MIVRAPNISLCGGLFAGQVFPIPFSHLPFPSSCALCLLLDVSHLLSRVTPFAHLIGDTILQASATSHMVSIEPAECEYLHRRKGKQVVRMHD